MKKLTKKSLDELAKTMNVIPENERENYWGMYDNDCFWRCIAYLSGDGISEEAAASYALHYFASQYSGSDEERIAQAISYIAQNGGAGMTNLQMSAYSYDGINKRQIAGFPPDILRKYGFSDDSNHVVVFKGTNPNGESEMYCPQTNTHFTMSFEDFHKRTF